MAIGAAVVAAVVGGVASYQSAKKQEKSAKKGRLLEQKLADQALEEQRRSEEQQREDLSSWRDAGENALGQIEKGIETGEFTMEDFDFTADPGYQFRLEEGIQARDRAAASRGRLLSGAQEKAITKYGQDIASQEYANVYARESTERANKYNILANVAARGQEAGVRQAGATSQTAAGVSNILSGMGRTANIAEQNVGAIRGGAYTDIATSANQGIQNWLLLKNLGAGGKK